MIRRPSTSRNQKSLKTRRSSRDGSSRVGPEYQVDIPEYIGPVQPCSASVNKIRELKLWSPKQQPQNNIYEEYIDFAKQRGCPIDTAMTFLHWHRYNIAKAKDDMLNYVAVKPNWTKGEVLKFLRCIDSKPRKNFVEAKKVVPGRLTGEISELYYSIAAPFKASTRKKHNGALIGKCFSRAVRSGLIVSRWTSPSNASNDNRLRRPGENRDALECEVEQHLVSLVGMKKTGRLLGRRMLSVPYPFLPMDNFTDAPNDRNGSTQTSHIPRYTEVFSNGDLDTNGPPVAPMITINTYQPSSSGASSQVDGEFSSQQQSQHHCLPPGTHYDHSEFATFASESETELAAQSEAEVRLNYQLDSELVKLVLNAESRASSILRGIETLKPVGGFPEISYRWSKPELALVLHAMSVYGDDFSKIARIIGSKSESFIQDFYNQFHDSFPLNEIIGHAAKLPEPAVDQTAKPEVSDVTSPGTDIAVSPAQSEKSALKKGSTVPEVTGVNCLDHTLLSGETTKATKSCSSSSSSSNPVSLSPDSTSCLNSSGETGKTPTNSVNCSPETKEASADKASRRPALRHVQEAAVAAPLPNSEPRRGRRNSSRFADSSMKQTDRADVAPAEQQEKKKKENKTATARRGGLPAPRRGCGRSAGRRGSRAASYESGPRLQIGIVPGPSSRGRGRRRRL